MTVATAWRATHIAGLAASAGREESDFIMFGLPRKNLICLLAVLLTAIVSAGQAGRSAATLPSTTAPAAKPLDVVYVFSPTCLNCKEAAKAVNAAAERYGQRICILRLDIQDPNALEQVLALEERYKAAAAAPPRVFVGSRYLTGLDAISGQLEAAIDLELKALAASQPHSQPTTMPRETSLARPAGCLDACRK